MAKLTFTERYRTNTTFKTAVDEFVHAAVLEMLGIDGEDLSAMWDGVKFAMSPREYIQNEVFVPPSEDDPYAEGPASPSVNPVEEMSGKEADTAISALEAVGDIAALTAVFQMDPRSSLAMRAARAIFDMRTAESQGN